VKIAEKMKIGGIPKVVLGEAIDENRIYSTPK
jgi:hypothetical protein